MNNIKFGTHVRPIRLLKFCNCDSITKLPFRIPLTSFLVYRHGTVRTYFQSRNDNAISFQHFNSNNLNQNKINIGAKRETKLLDDERKYNAEMMDAIKRFQDRRRRQTVIMIISSFLISVISYQIIYRTIWSKEESYIPIWVCPRTHSLTRKERSKLNLNAIHDKIIRKVIFQMMDNKIVLQWYKLPIQLNDLDDEKFNIWCEDVDPVMFGVAFRPLNENNGTIDSNVSSGIKSKNQDKWWEIPHFLQFRFKHKSISLTAKIKQLKDMINDIIIFGTPNYDNRPYIDSINDSSNNTMFDTFQNEYPINGSNHSMHLCFEGKLPIGKDSEIEYVGKYHIDIKFEKIILKRHSEGKIIQIDLLQD